MAITWMGPAGIASRSMAKRGHGWFPKSARPPQPDTTMLKRRVTSMIKDIDSVLEEIVKRIGNAVPVKQVILFGSYARGKQDSESDLDLLIIAPFMDRPVTRRMMIRGLLKDFDRQIGIDILAYTPDDDAEMAVKYMTEICGPLQNRYDDLK
jgi:predicted nucleotidyltransferase